MPDKWIAKAVGLMHTHHITGGALAEKMGIRREYLSAILNGKRCPKDAEQKIMSAINEMISIED